MKAGKQYKLNVIKIKDLSDVIRILNALDLTFTVGEKYAFEDIKDLLKEKI